MAAPKAMRANILARSNVQLRDVDERENRMQVETSSRAGFLNESKIGTIG
jgi:hypothetical protein